VPIVGLDPTSEIFDLGPRLSVPLVGRSDSRDGANELECPTRHHLERAQTHDSPRIPSAAVGENPRRYGINLDQISEMLWAVLLD
jgi:hypothetical protein